MNRAALLAIIGAIGLVAACAPKQAEETAPANSEVPREGAAGDELGPKGASEAAADGGMLACVKDVPTDAICTMDLNQCGHSGSCNCGPGYIYNASMGKCLLIMDGITEAVKADVADDDCTKPAAGACTRDINVCGHPSSCQCEEGFAWNATAGKCVKGG